MAKKKIDESQILTLAEWAEVVRSTAGKSLNLNSLRKRRRIAGVGKLVPPRTYLLTAAEFRKVLATPLPLSTKVIDIPKF